MHKKSTETSRVVYNLNHSRTIKIVISLLRILNVLVC